MGRRVLGNDPFQRGAAERPEVKPATEPSSAPVPVHAPAVAAPRSATRARPTRPATHAPGAARSSEPPPVEARAAPPLEPAPVNDASWLPDLPTLLVALREAPALAAAAAGALEAAGRALRAGLGTGDAAQVDVYGRDAGLSAAVAPLVDFLYRRWFRVAVEGAERVPAGGALLVANHAGALPLDGPVLQEALRRERPDLPEARWLAEDQVFYAPLLGTLFNRLGAVRASPDSATRLLAEGRPVCIFPEGIQGIGKPFRERYVLKRFGRGGFVKLALRTGRPILPVAIVGGEETLPLLGKLPGGFLGLPYLPVTPLGPLPLPAKWRIRIGEPLAVPPGASEADLPLVESLVDATRSTIAQMLRELLGARGGVFLG